MRAQNTANIKFDEFPNDSELDESHPMSGKALNDRQNESQFTFFKKQEISQFFYDSETDTFSRQASALSLYSDHTDFKVDIIDNGDEKVSVVCK